jgi:tetratricopeptide (TPR) repeat protein
MNRGDKVLILLAATALAGCNADSGRVEVRPIADPAAKFRQGSADVAAARGQLALGNVGLALEAFRIIQRNRPTDPAAPAGIAECYAAMGRLDLAESSFEAALALAPHDPKLLLGLAAIFEQQGHNDRALAVRVEAAAAQAAAAAVVPAAPIQAKPRLAAAPMRKSNAPKVPHVGSITVELPEARPADLLATGVRKAQAQLARAVEIAPIAPAAPVAVQAPLQLSQGTAAMPLRSTITVSLPVARSAERLTMDSDAARLQLAQAAATVRLEPAPTDAIAATTAAPHGMLPEPSAPEEHVPPRSSITVALPPARPSARFAMDSVAARSELAQAAVTMPLQLTAPSAPPPEPRPAPLKSADMSVTLAEAAGPRIERISPGQVMLVTTGRPLWKSPTASRSLASNTVRWIPLGNATVRPNVQVLNAARRDGIARSARAVLLDRGWRRIKVADAPIMREKSVVLYPRGRAALGRSLAAQFGVTAEASDIAFPTLLLGRDAPHLVRSQRKS